MPYDRFSQTRGAMTERIVVGELPVGGQEPLISSAIRWGDLLFLSGRAPIDTPTMEVVCDGLRGAGAERPRPDHRLPRGGRLWPRARAARPVLPARRVRLRRLEPRSGPSTSRRRGPCGRRSSRLRGARDADRGRGHRRRPGVKVVVVGGGIAGLCCAYYLRRRGVDVTMSTAPGSARGRPLRGGTAAGSRPPRPGRCRSRA